MLKRFFTGFAGSLLVITGILLGAWAIGATLTYIHTQLAVSAQLIFLCILVLAASIGFGILNASEQ